MPYGHDLRCAVRRFFQSPGFSLIVVLVLALGIGANTAIFSTIDSVSLKPLPYRDPDRLVLARRTVNHSIYRLVSAPDYYDYRQQATRLESLGAVYAALKVAVKGGPRPEYVAYTRASPDLFRALGVAPVAGRWFTPEEAVAGAPYVVLVSERFARRRFGDPQTAIGRTLALGPGFAVGRSAPVETVATVIGVMPEGFRFLEQVDIWVAQRRGEADGPANRQFHNWILVGRLKPGISIEAAQNELDVISGRLQALYPHSNADKALRLDPLQAALFEARTPRLMILMGAAGLVLLIACANVAGLLLARGLARRAELATCAALGASRSRIAGGLLIESLLLALVAGMLGILLAVWLAGLLPAATGLAACGVEIHGLRWPVLLFAVGVTLGTGLLAGVMPALRVSSADLWGQLGSLRATQVKGGTRLRGALVIGQVAVSVILLIGAILLIRSFARLTGVDPGFDSHNLLTGMIEAPKPSPEERVQLMEELRQELAAIPGATAVAFTSNLPIVHPYGDPPMWAADNPPADPAKIQTSHFRNVLPGYFAALRIPLLAGRALAATDRAGTPRVLVINQTMARGLFPGRSPLGRRVMVETGEPQATPFEVVGVVGDARIESLDQPPPMTMYAPYAQVPNARLYFMIRTRLAPEAVVETVRRIVAPHDPGIPVEDLESLERLIGDSLLSQRVTAVALTLLSGVAMLLASVGLYGVLAYSVSQRMQELGIRIALGAAPGDVVRMVARQGLALAAAGVAVGLAGAFALTRFMATLLFEVRPADPWTFAGASIGLLAVAVSAGCAPALRAARIDPILALRSE
jgi:putative ABC transport system permease protein